MGPTEPRTGQNDGKLMPDSNPVTVLMDNCKKHEKKFNSTCWLIFYIMFENGTVVIVVVIMVPVMVPIMVPKSLNRAESPSN